MFTHSPRGHPGGESFEKISVLVRTELIRKTVKGIDCERHTLPCSVPDTVPVSGVEEMCTFLVGLVLRSCH